MKARYIIETFTDEGEPINVYLYTRDIKDKKQFDKEMVKGFSAMEKGISVTTVSYLPEVKDTKSLYKKLNKAKLYREFKDKYDYPDMRINSYRRVLWGQSTYLGKGRSPYIADMFRFFSEKLGKSFIDIAYDLLDSEYMGKKNTLLDVLVADKNISKEEAVTILKDKAFELDAIRLCDLDKDTRKLYDEARLTIK